MLQTKTQMFEAFEKAKISFDLNKKNAPRKMKHQKKNRNKNNSVNKVVNFGAKITGKTVRQFKESVKCNAISMEIITQQYLLHGHWYH